VETRGGRLLLLPGRSVDVVPWVANELGVDKVVAHSWTEPVGIRRDEIIAQRLGVPFELWEGERLLPSGAVLNGSGEPYKVFTPFARAARLQLDIPAPLPAPKTFPSRLPLPSSVRKALIRIPKLSDLGIIHNPDTSRGGEAAARARLKSFLRRARDYRDSRDQMGDETGSSRLSQDLKFGTLSVRTVYRAALAEPKSDGISTFLTQLLWREFAYDNLFHRPELLSSPYRSEFRNFPYDGSDSHYEAWALGRTGVPIVDASARQLLREGYVHNRARMISASFLTKNLLIPHARGEAHYLKFLTDGDWALNNMGWQWSAGCGVDAAPYFRVFNPVLQGKKFDSDGAYVRRFVPELARLPNRFLHSPWSASPDVLSEAGVTLGKNYPEPIVDLKASREQFLARTSCLK